MNKFSITRRREPAGTTFPSPSHSSFPCEPVTYERIELDYADLSSLLEDAHYHIHEYRKKFRDPPAGLLLPAYQYLLIKHYPAWKQTCEPSMMGHPVSDDLHLMGIPVFCSTIDEMAVIPGKDQAIHFLEEKET